MNKDMRWFDWLLVGLMVFCLSFLMGNFYASRTAGTQPLIDVETR